MKVLLTGATGFIGSHLWPALEAYNTIEVIKVTRKSLPGFVQIPDLSERIDWSQYISDIEVVVHLAGVAHGKLSSDSDKPHQVRDVNLYSTLELAKQSIASGVKKFIFMSSIGVHGEFSDGSVISETSKLSPDNDYAASKAAAEKSLQELFKNSSSQLFIIRPPLVYGINAPGNFGTMVKLAAASIPLPFKGISNSRSLISVNNLVNFLRTLIVSETKVAGTFIVSDAKPISTAEIFNCLAKGMNKQSKLFYFPVMVLRLFFYVVGRKKLYDKAFGNYIIDSSKAREQLNWHPEFDTREELIQIGEAVAKK